MNALNIKLGREGDTDNRDGFYFLDSFICFTFVVRVGKRLGVRDIREHMVQIEQNIFSVASLRSCRVSYHPPEFARRFTADLWNPRSLSPLFFRFPFKPGYLVAFAKWPSGR